MAVADKKYIKLLYIPFTMGRQFTNMMVIRLEEGVTDAKNIDRD